MWKGIRTYPADERGETLEVPLGIEPLISPERWHAAQQIIRERRTTWSKRQTYEPRFLAASLLYCDCGRKFYFHCDNRRGYHDDYFCSSRRSGTGCGSARLRRERVDAAVEQFVSRQLTAAKFMHSIVAALKQTSEPDRAKRERGLAKLQTKRERIIDAYTEGVLTKQEFTRRLNAVADEVRGIESLMPEALSVQPDVRRLITGLARVAARFRKLPFEEKRSILKRVIRRIEVADGAIPEIMVSGTFLQEFTHTNSLPRSTAQCSLQCQAPVPERQLS